MDELARFFDETLGFAPNSVLTMQRRPSSALAFINLNKAVMADEGRLTAEQKRLIGLLASSVAGCRYREAHTALAARGYGASQVRLDSLWEYATSPLFTAAERAALDFAIAAANSPNAVTNEIASELKQHRNDGEVVEIVAVIALFGFLNRWNDSMGTVLEEGAAEIGERQLSSRGWSRGKHV